jgi:hypothetical protein
VTPSQYSCASNVAIVEKVWDVYITVVVSGAAVPGSKAYNIKESK